MKELNRPKKEDYDFNDNIEGVRYAKDMNDYADKLEEQLRLYNVTCSADEAITLFNFYAKESCEIVRGRRVIVNSEYAKQYEEIENWLKNRSKHYR